MVRNQIITMRRTLEEILPHSERWPVRDLVFEALDSLQNKILAHSKSVEQIFGAQAILRRPHEPEGDQREAYAARIAAMKGRQ